MIPIVCIDDRQGMMFNHRRQSMDERLRKDLLKEIAPKKLWMNAYSAKQFQEEIYENLEVCEEFLDKADDNEYCFVENQSLANYVSKITQIIIYRWNRCYPADLYLNLDLSQSHWSCVSRTEFVGKSHERITKEVYHYEI